MKHQHRGRPHHFFVFSYPVTLGDRVWTFIAGPLLVVVLVALFAVIDPPAVAAHAVTVSTIATATIFTLARLAVAYVLAVVVAIPLALLAEASPTAETLLLPVFDVFQSIPNLAVLPILVVFFLRVGFLDGAAIVILFLSMLWNIVFALVGGVKVIPRDVKDAAHIFGLRGASYIKRLVLPAIFPQFVTGSILAVASGWNIIIVAEALHVYAPPGTSPQDLFGIGSLLVSASATGQSGTYFIAFAVMVAVIALFNLLVWQKLLHYAQRFRFE